MRLSWFKTFLLFFCNSKLLWIICFPFHTTSIKQFSHPLHIHKIIQTPILKFTNNFILFFFFSYFSFLLSFFFSLFLRCSYSFPFRFLSSDASESLRMIYMQICSWRQSSPIPQTSVLARDVRKSQLYWFTSYSYRQLMESALQHKMEGTEKWEKWIRTISSTIAFL